MFLTGDTLRHVLRMSSLRQAIVIAVCLLASQVIGTAVTFHLIKSGFSKTEGAILEQRFQEVSKQIEQQGAGAIADLAETGEAIYYLADKQSAARAPVGLFIHRGHLTNDEWAEPYDDSIVDLDNWQFFVGQTSQSVLAIGRFNTTKDLIGNAIPSTFLTVGVSISAIVLSVGLWSGLRSQRRVARISRTLDKVASGNLKARILPNTRNDDLDDLAIEIDHALDQLDALFHQSRELAANIAHDLRTPLTRLRLGLEETILLKGEEAKEQAEKTLKNCDEIIEIFDAYLRISKIETGVSRGRFVPVDLAELANEVGATFLPVAQDAGFHFETRSEKGATVHGDPVLLTQFLTNLISNALQHTPVGSTIRVIAEENTLGVSDNGPGVAAEAYDQIIKPTVRMESSRSSPGAGLGLALVKAIAEAHDAELVLSPNASSGRGLFVGVVFPEKNI